MSKKKDKNLSVKAYLVLSNFTDKLLEGEFANDRQLDGLLITMNFTMSRGFQSK